MEALPPALLEYEGIMQHLAQIRGWEFVFEQKPVPVEAVFGPKTYGPAILQNAVHEAIAHGIGHLGVSFEGDYEAVFGAKMIFDKTATDSVATFFRLVLSASVIEALRLNNVVDLTLLQRTFGTRFAAYLRRNDEQARDSLPYDDPLHVDPDLVGPEGA